MMLTNTSEDNKELKPPSLDDILSGFSSYLTTRVSKGTKELYMINIIRWVRWVLQNVNGVNSVNIVNKTGIVDALNEKSAQDYINMLTKSKSSSTASVSGHAVLRFLRWRGIDAKLEMPPISFSEPKYKTMEEVSKLLSNCDTPLERALITMLFDSGVRITELLNLKLSDIDWKSTTITVTRKGGRRDDVNISDKSIVALSEWLSNRKFKSDKVFGNLTYYQSWKMIKKIGVRSGIVVTPHTFRHSRAIQMLKNGADMYVVQQHLGHRRIATTMDIYGRFRAADLKDKIPDW